MSTEIRVQSRRPLYKGSDSAMFASARSNAGLWYDKFCGIWERDWTIREGGKLAWVQSVTGRVGCTDQLQAFACRQSELASGIGGLALPFITVTRFATGLGREHPIKIGFAWHHTLGTPYLPGSSVKGLLRAYVRECFGEDFASVLFGLGAEHCVGKWIFFDAIPSKPVRLEADVMTPHYGPYYQGNAAPGDWHSPNPIPFLAVAREQHFQFAFAPRDASDTGKDADGKAVTNETIADWLAAALNWFGAGAKTNSGFGVFKPLDGAAVSKLANSEAPGQRRSFKATLELITPAFLAGADQSDPTDCDLRPATLRGQLRYWWRTLHAGYLTVDELRALEAAVWGSTNGAGAIRVVIVPGNRPDPVLYDKTRVVNMRPDQKISAVGIPDAVPKKTTQGLWYATFGMDGTKDRGRQTEERKQRFCLLPGANWTVIITIRSCNSDFCLTLEHILAQAQAALWLLCEYGGVGSKARKGFGSLKLDGLDDWSLDECNRVSGELRAAIKLSNKFSEQRIESPALCVSLPAVEQTFLWDNVWAVLDQLGFAYQTFAKRFKHRLEKQALGLPHPTTAPHGSFEPRGPIKAMIERAPRSPENIRHASPIHIHLAGGRGTYVVRILALPAAFLPDLATSRQFLTEFRDVMSAELSRRRQLHEPTGFGNPAATSHRIVPQPTGVANVTLQVLTREAIKSRLAQLKSGEALMQVESTQTGQQRVQRLEIRNVPAGYQSDGGWSIDGCPSFPPRIVTVVLGQLVAGVKRVKFVEVFGKLPQAPQSTSKGRGPNRGGPRR